jgi:putative ABC transport system ATP-binding protein
VGDRGTGPSGSGKTTFLTLIGALRELQTGSISLLGQELRGAKPEVLVEARRGIGFIFQQHNLLPAFTAGENVQLTLAVHPGLSPRDCRMRAIELLSAVGMSEHLSSGRLSFREVSPAGGDCQGAGAAPARDFGR